MIKDSIAECIPHANPLERPDYTEAEVQALRAIARGEATEDQQHLALDWMVRACCTYDTSMRGDPHLTAFAEGKRFAGTTLVWMLNVAPTRTDPDKIATRNMKQ